MLGWFSSLKEIKQNKTYKSEEHSLAFSGKCMVVSPKTLSPLLLWLNPSSYICCKISCTNDCSGLTGAF